MRVPYREDSSFINIVLVTVKGHCIVHFSLNSLQEMGTIFHLQDKIFIFLHTISLCLYGSNIAISGLYGMPMIIHELCGLALNDLRVTGELKN